jgi:hypothetical protein
VKRPEVRRCRPGSEPTADHVDGRPRFPGNSEIAAERDRALAAPGTELAARLGVEPVLAPGTHEAIITHADDVAKALQASLQA